MPFRQTRPESKTMLPVCGDDPGDHPGRADTDTPRRMNRRNFVVTGVAAGAAAPFALREGLDAFSRPAGATPGLRGDFGYPPADTTSRIVKDITFPVEGEVDWTDTYQACRAGCSRHHEGQDLIGDKLQKLIACVDAEVVELRHRDSGNSLYLRGDDGYYYVYLHINNDSPGTDDAVNPREWAFAPGVTDGGRVQRGQHVAYMGDSGNAEHITHLHFEMRKPADRVWDSQAINAAPSLGNASPPPPQVPPETFAPFDNAEDFIRQQFQDFQGHLPGRDRLRSLATTLERGDQPPRAVPADELLPSDRCQDRAGSVIRLYQAFFRRPPDTGGYRYWTEQVNQTGSLGPIADFFESSAEFQATYGSLDTDAFVDLVYSNVLGRDADIKGRRYWVGEMNRGALSRGRVMLHFSDSAEFRARQRLDTNVDLMYGSMLRRIPDDADHYYWRAHIDADYTTFEQLAKVILNSPEYRARFD